MKRIILILLVLLLLTGCAAGDVPVTEAPTEPTAPPTDPPVPWTQEVGRPWDEDGVLLEMPLTIPDSLHYSNYTAFDGDLLLWSIDSHLGDVMYLELCLVELDDGSVIAQQEVEMSSYFIPQVLGKSLFLCDTHTGRICQLDKQLTVMKEWTAEPQEATWYMGSGEKLYRLDFDSNLTVLDLATGESALLMEDDPVVVWMEAFDGFLTVHYYDNATGVSNMLAVDILSGRIMDPDLVTDLINLDYVDGSFLGGRYKDANIYYFRNNGGPMMWLPHTDNQFSLLDEGYLLETSADNNYVWLYDLEGNLISSAQIQSAYNGYTGLDMIWNEEFGGYFFIYHNYDQAARLLFWDISKSAGGEDLTLEEVPAPDEAMVQLRQRADEIGEKYGVHIVLGEECDTEFVDFTASHATDWEQVNSALDILEEALSAYPEGFIQQLRYDTYYRTEIQLVCDLWATGVDRQGAGYVGFTQDLWDHHLMVIDINVNLVDTYYHEFSHIIDSYLEWDAMQRKDALFCEDGWAQWNPDWFTGYSYDYSIMHELYDLTSFTDSYATISPTEDRARVMEYAMVGYQWTFEDAYVLQKKLDYYCRCIRDAFDTTGWPDTVIWEQFQYLD